MGGGGRLRCQAGALLSTQQSAGSTPCPWPGLVVGFGVSGRAQAAGEGQNKLQQVQKHTMG